MGKGKNENKKDENIQHNLQNSGTVMYFLVQNLKIKNGEQLQQDALKKNILEECMLISKA